MVEAERNGEEIYVETHQLPVTVHAMVGIHDTYTEYEVEGNNRGTNEMAGYVSTDVAEAVEAEYGIDVAEFGFEIVDMSAEEIAVS